MYETGRFYFSFGKQAINITLNITPIYDRHHTRDDNLQCTYLTSMGIGSQYIRISSLHSLSNCIRRWYVFIMCFMGY